METVEAPEAMQDLPYIVEAKNLTIKWLDMSYTLDETAGVFSADELFITECVWTQKDWRVTFGYKDMPGLRYLVSHYGGKDETTVEEYQVVEDESAQVSAA